MITPGFGRCAECGDRVLFALAVSGDVIAFDAAFEDGPWAVAWDITRTPRCRPVGKTGAIRDGEYLYRQHAATCTASPAPVAGVRPIRSARSLRRVGRSVPARRTANAR